MTWKRWLVVALLVIVVIKAPHMVAQVLQQVGHSLGYFWDQLGVN